MINLFLFSGYILELNMNRNPSFKINSPNQTDAYGNSLAGISNAVKKAVKNEVKNAVKNAVKNDLNNLTTRFISGRIDSIQRPGIEKIYDRPAAVIKTSLHGGIPCCFDNNNNVIQLFEQCIIPNGMTVVTTNRSIPMNVNTQLGSTSDRVFRFLNHVYKNKFPFIDSNDNMDKIVEKLSVIYDSIALGEGGEVDYTTNKINEDIDELRDSIENLTEENLTEEEIKEKIISINESLDWLYTFLQFNMGFYKVYQGNGNNTITNTVYINEEPSEEHPFDWSQHLQIINFGKSSEASTYNGRYGEASPFNININGQIFFNAHAAFCSNRITRQPGQRFTFLCDILTQLNADGIKLVILHGGQCATLMRMSHCSPQQGIQYLGEVEEQISKRNIVRQVNNQDTGKAIKVVYSGTMTREISSIPERKKTILQRQFIPLYNKFKNVFDPLEKKYQNLITIHNFQGGSKPKKSKTKKRRNYKSKRRNYRKKSRSTRRRRY